MLYHHQAIPISTSRPLRETPKVVYVGFERFSGSAISPLRCGRGPSSDSKRGLRKPLHPRRRSLPSYRPQRLLALKLHLSETQAADRHTAARAPEGPGPIPKQRKRLSSRSDFPFRTTPLVTQTSQCERIMRNVVVRHVPQSQTWKTPCMG